MRLAVFCDYRFWRRDERIVTERAFIVFVGGLVAHFDRLVMPGRLAPAGDAGEIARYPLPEGIEFVALPWYPSLASPLRVARALAGGMRRFWRVLDEVEAVWLLGPHPTALAFAALAVLRRRKLILGVRQDLPAYTASKHPEGRGLQLAARLLEGAWRLLARRAATVVVGPDLARNYHHARRLLAISVSLVRREQVPALPPPRDWGEETLRALSVGRLEAEKNPLLLADVLARLREIDPRWRLVICGEGPMEGELRDRLERLAVAEHADVVGYVPIDRGLMDLYRDSHALLHVSWTEGVPQILFEAFAAGLPVVATAVGGVAEAAEGAALLVPPGDADAPAAGLVRLAGDEELRARLAESGLERARERTLEAETGRLAAFIRGAS